MDCQECYRTFLTQKSPGSYSVVRLKAQIYGGTLNMSLEQQIANEHPNALNLLGMDRMTRRAYEAATSDNPSMTKVWHDAEVLAAERRRDLTPPNSCLSLRRSSAMTG